MVRARLVLLMLQALSLQGEVLNVFGLRVNMDPAASGSSSVAAPTGPSIDSNHSATSAEDLERNTNVPRQQRRVTFGLTEVMQIDSVKNKTSRVRLPLTAGAPPRSEDKPDATGVTGMREHPADRPRQMISAKICFCEVPEEMNSVGEDMNSVPARRDRQLVSAAVLMQDQTHSGAFN